MAEHLQTLTPLRAQERREIDPRSDEDILAMARQRFAEAEDSERDERQQQYEAVQFRSGQHWPQWMLQQRSIPGQEQPSLVVDRTYQFEAQILNSYRRNPLGI